MLEDDSKMRAEAAKQEIAEAVRALIECAADSEAGRVASQSFRSATDALLDVVKLGRERGLSRLDIHSAITDAARGKGTTQEVRTDLYDAIKSIAPD